MTIVLTPAARADIRRASEWYEARENGLGLKFLDRVDQALDKIQLNPGGYQKVFGENRHCPLEKFPYALYFKAETEAIVVACLHGKLRPRMVREIVRGVRLTEP